MTNMKSISNQPVSASKNVSIDQLKLNLQSGAKIFVHTAAASPEILLDKLCDEVRTKNLTGIEVYHLHIEGRAPHVAEEFRDRIKTYCLFVGANCRLAVKEGRAEYIPMFLSEIPLAIKRGIFKFDLALMQFSAIDAKGYLSLGVSVDISLAALQHTPRIIALVNEKMPFVHGAGIVHISKIEQFTLINQTLPEQKMHKSASQEIIQIGKHVASLIEDGATLQMGIGEIPNAVLSNLHQHQHLGIHSEMISDGIIDLMESGAVDNSLKKIMPGKTVASFALGSTRLYDYIHHHPLFLFNSADIVNAPSIIQLNPKVCAINSAIEVDLTGQVCADSLGPNIFSGVGGQVDFMRGAFLSEGGKAIIAMQSRCHAGNSKIVKMLTPGSGVVTTRAHIHYVVTEYGIADLYGKSLQQRAKALINIAHPDDRDFLFSKN